MEPPFTLRGGLLYKGSATYTVSDITSVDYFELNKPSIGYRSTIPEIIMTALFYAFWIAVGLTTYLLVFHPKMKFGTYINWMIISQLVANYLILAGLNSKPKWYRTWRLYAYHYNAGRITLYETSYLPQLEAYKADLEQYMVRWAGVAPRGTPTIISISKTEHPVEPADNSRWRDTAQLAATAITITTALVGAGAAVVNFLGNGFGA